MGSAAKIQRGSGRTQTVTVEDLSGGLDQRKASTLLTANRSRVLRNFSLREPGALTVYPGWETFSTASLGAGRPQGAQRIYFGTGTPFTLGAWNGVVYKPSDVGAWGAAVSTGWSVATQIDFPFDRDLVAIFDATTAAKKSTNGTTWTNFGIAAPSTPPTSANLAGGSLVSGNTYEFSFSGIDDELLAEGNESARVTHVPSGGNLSVRLTLTAHQDSTDQVDTLAVYARDTTAGETVRRRVGTVADPGAGTVTYDVTTNNWSSGVPAPSDHDTPELMKFAVIWKNRWWGVDAVVGNRLRFTQIFENQSWPATFYIDIPFERGDNITALSPQGDTLVVWGQGKPFLVIGQTSLDFEVRPAGAAQAGALGFRATAQLEEGVVHAAAEGIYLFDGATDRLLSFDVDGFAPNALGWRSYVTTASQADLVKTPVVYHQASKEVSIGVTVLYPFGTAGEWILDLNRTRTGETPAWTTTDRAIGGYLSWDGNEPTAGNRGRLFSWSQTIGSLAEERTGTTADGADMSATYSGPALVLGNHIARVIEGAVQFEPHGGTFGVELVVDTRSLGSQSIDIAGTTSVYGTAVYGTAVYGGPNRVRKPLTFPLDAEGLTAEITGTYTGQEAWKWFGYELDVQPEPMGRGF